MTQKREGATHNHTHHEPKKYYYVGEICFQQRDVLALEKEIKTDENKGMTLNGTWYSGVAGPFSGEKAAKIFADNMGYGLKDIQKAEELAKNPDSDLLEDLREGKEDLTGQPLAADL